MNKIKIYFFAAAIILLFICSCAEEKSISEERRILIVIEDRLVQPLQDELKVYKSDLENEGYEVSIISEVSSNSKPIEIKQIVANDYNTYSNLQGAIFIGNIAAPLYNKLSDQGDPYWHDYLADFFYMDLDGIWIDSDKNGVYDQHLDTENELWSKIRKKLGIGDNRTPEIWISRIRADKLTSIGNEVELLKGYFHKNHLYRTGQMNLPPQKAFIVSAGVNVQKSDWGAYPEIIYSDIDSDKFHESLADTLRKFLKSEYGYEWGVINVFSGPRIHHFNHFNDEIDSKLWKTKEGRQEIADYSDRVNHENDVTSTEIDSIQPKVLFYHLLTSEVGRHDYVDNLGSTYIFSGYGLSAVAGTQHSGSVGSKIMYNSLVKGNTLGASWKTALDWLVENDKEKISIFYYPDSEERLYAGKSNYKAVLLGDGTLKLPQFQFAN